MRHSDAEQEPTLAELTGMPFDEVAADLEAVASDFMNDAEVAEVMAAADAASKQRPLGELTAATDLGATFATANNPDALALSRAMLRRVEAAREERIRARALFFELAVKALFADELERELAAADRELLEARATARAEDLAFRLAQRFRSGVSDAEILTLAEKVFRPGPEDGHRRALLAAFEGEGARTWALLTYVWPEVAAEWREDAKARIGAARALATLTSDELGDLDRGKILGRTIEAIAEHLPTALAETGAPTTLDDATEAARIYTAPDGARRYERAELAARYVERLGPFGNEIATALRAGAGAAMAQLGTTDAPLPWQDWRHPAHLAGILGRALLRTTVLPALHRELKRGVPGLPREVFQSITRVATPGLQLELLQVTRPHPLKPRHGDRVPVAVLPAAATEEVMRAVLQGLPYVASRYALPLVESIIAKAHEQHLETNDPVDSRRVVYDHGGWDAVACTALEKQAVHPEERGAIIKVARALAAMPLQWLDGARSSSLWHIDESAAAAGRGRGRAHIVFMLAERAAWGEVFRDARGQRVVPLPRPRNLPPLPLSPRNTYAPQAAFLRLLWLHFADCSAELVAGPGLVSVDDVARARLACEAQLIARLVMPLLDHFVRAGALVGGGDRFAPADPTIRAFLREGAARQVDAAQAKAAARTRRQRAPR